ncbi:MAG TPA: sporulation membrane protein YtaF [Bacillus bacterium]|nr:sporulation membrane protein YtaF [Bacillus sp. (in: firmicutes)]
MGQLLTLFILGLAVSLDSFSVGLTYGIRKVSIPLKSIFIISICTFVVLLLAMGIGTWIEVFVSANAAATLGGCILIAIGIWLLVQFFTAGKKGAKQDKEILVDFEIKSLGIIIKVLKKPMVADLDQSGNIRGIEAFILGFALSLDSFGAGIGAALIDLPPILSALFIASASALLLIAGIKMGELFRNVKWIQKITFLPGVLLILIGFLKM